MAADVDPARHHTASAPGASAPGASAPGAGGRAERAGEHGDDADGPARGRAGDASLESSAGGSHTNWDLIHAARDGGPAAHPAWEALVRRYWPAILAYLRRFTRDGEEVADLAQGFLTDVVLQRRLLDRADPERGRFRTLLLTSLRNYARQMHRDRTRLKRGGSHRTTSLDHGAPPPSGDRDPEAAFGDAWRRQLVRDTVERVRKDCERESLGAHWQVFEARVVRPMLTGATPVPYPGLVERLDLEDAAQAANMMITVKRRFARTIRLEIRRTIEDPAAVEDEIRELLSSGDAGSRP